MTPTPDLYQRVGTFAAGRYNALRSGATHAHALGYMAILEQVRNLPTESPDPERVLLDFMSKPHADPDTAKACKTTLENIGSSGKARDVPGDEKSGRSFTGRQVLI